MILRGYYDDDDVEVEFEHFNHITLTELVKVKYHHIPSGRITTVEYEMRFITLHINGYCISHGER